MDWDDQNTKPTPVAIGADLAALSIGELDARVQAFGLEIERLQAEIAVKKAGSHAADRLFKR